MIASDDFQGWNQTVELLLDPHALDLHFGAQGVADVVVKTGDGAFRGFHRKGRVRRFDTDAHRLGLIGHAQG